jgi:biotin transport system substrate-specific component
MSSQVAPGALSAADTPSSSRAAWLGMGGSIALAIALVSIAARIAVPLPGTPVPVTLQDLVVLAVGIVLGPRRGALAIASYVILGAMGAPVFANGGSGVPWLMGATGGYLLAFPLAAAVVGLGARTRRMIPFVAALLAAHAVTFTGGVLQLALVSGNGLRAAATAGFIPFIPGILLKSALLIAFFAGWTRWRKPGAPTQDA